MLEKTHRPLPDSTLGDPYDQGKCEEIFLGEFDVSDAVLLKLLLVFASEVFLNLVACLIGSLLLVMARENIERRLREVERRLREG